MLKQVEKFHHHFHKVPVLLASTSILFLLLWQLFMSFPASALSLSPNSLGSISGVMLNSNAQPVDGIIVSLRSVFQSYPAYQITTTENGVFNFTGLIPGVYRLHADDTAKVFSSQYYSATNAFDTATDIRINGNRVKNIHFILLAPGQITGKISLSGDSPPVITDMKNYASLYSRDSGSLKILANTEILSSTGEYTFSALLPAVYQICADIHLPLGGGVASSCYGGIDLEKAAAITVTSGVSTTNINFDVDYGQFEGAIGGQVSVQGIPIANIRVDLQGGNAFNSLSIYTLTNGSGHYEFRGLPAGAYSALFSDPTDRYPRVWHDLRPAAIEGPSLNYDRPIQLELGQVISDVDVDMPEYGMIQGRVVRYNPPLLPGEEISVGLSYATTNSHLDFVRTTTVDASGSYNIVRVFPGLYTVSFVYCFPQGNGTGCIYRYYGMSSTDTTAKPITVHSGQITTGIDSIIGFDPTIYLPIIVSNR